MKKTGVLLCLLLLAGVLYGQQGRIITDDITRFWHTYDSVLRLTNERQQEEVIRRLYLDAGSRGLKELAAIRGWTPAKFRTSITSHPRFWQSVRARTQHLDSNIVFIHELMRRYRQLYPPFKEPDVYFTIGYIGTGGTTTQTEILIGTEIAVADSTVDASGLHPLLQQYFATNKGVNHLVAHEITHTQQAGGDMENRRKSNLLGFCIAEGVCDFMAELLLNEPLETPYIRYGKAHELAVWQQFEQEMHGHDITNWLYNGSTKTQGDADLGYFVGYAICQSYYRHAGNKTRAVHDMLTLDFENLQGLDAFVAKSQYGDQWKRR
jgi:hypothetical protein